MIVASVCLLPRTKSLFVHRQLRVHCDVGRFILLLLFASTRPTFDVQNVAPPPRTISYPWHCAIRSPLAYHHPDAPANPNAYSLVRNDCFWETCGNAHTWSLPAMVAFIQGKTWPTMSTVSVNCSVSPINVKKFFILSTAWATIKSSEDDSSSAAASSHSVLSKLAV
jgi:hypothetical protein